MPVSLTRLRICCGMCLPLSAYSDPRYYSFSLLRHVPSYNELRQVYSKLVASSTVEHCSFSPPNCKSTQLLLSRSHYLRFTILSKILYIPWSTQVMEYCVLCCPLIAVDVIVNDHNLSPSRMVQVMKELIAWPQATSNNQRSFPMPDIWFRVSTLAQSRYLSSSLDANCCGQDRGSRLICIESGILTNNSTLHVSIAAIFRAHQQALPVTFSARTALFVFPGMAYQGSYYLLWTQQTHLFNEIALLKHHTADIERQLSRAQQTLDNPDTKRHDRRKAKWVANSQRKYLKGLERTLHSLLLSLSACQSQIARIHIEASQQASQYGNAWTTYHDPRHGDITPTQETHQYQARSSTPDSGFSEPALYAQPFDLDLSQDQSNHTFSHELQYPLPLSINTQVVDQTPPPIRITPLSPSAELFTPTSKPTYTKAISPLATPFSPFIFAKANPPSPNKPINSKPLFTQPIWSSPNEWSEQVEEAMTPISPTARLEDGKLGFKKRYSVAAVELIESRLRHKKQVSDVARGLRAQG